MNVERFLDLYRQLELSVRSKYNLSNSDSISYFLSHNKEFVEYEDEIRYASDIRNLVSHNPKINGEYAIDISKSCLEFMENLITKIDDKKTLKDIMVPIKKVQFAYNTTAVKDVISSLADKTYNHVPVKNGEKIIGVLDEMSIFDMIKDGVEFNETLRFVDIQKYIDINRENAPKYLHAKEDVYVDDLKSTFTRLYKEGKRVALVFVEDESSNLKGIISTTDILGE